MGSLVAVVITGDCVEIPEALMGEQVSRASIVILGRADGWARDQADVAESPDARLAAFTRRPREQWLLDLCFLSKLKLSGQHHDPLFATVSGQRRSTKKRCYTDKSHKARLQPSTNGPYRTAQSSSSASSASASSRLSTAIFLAWPLFSLRFPCICSTELLGFQSTSPPPPGVCRCTSTTQPAWPALRTDQPSTLDLDEGRESEGRTLERKVHGSDGRECRAVRLGVLLDVLVQGHEPAPLDKVVHHPRVAFEEHCPPGRY